MKFLDPITGGVDATLGAVTMSTPLGIASGGTNSTATATANGVGYGTGTAHAYTAAGTTGQVLTATTGSAPTWAAPAGGAPAGTYPNPTLASTISTALTLSAGTTTLSGGLVALTNGTSNYLTFANGVGAPAFTTRSIGTKIMYYPTTLDGTHAEYATGIEAGTLWNSVPQTGQQFKWYGGTTLAATLTGVGALTLVAGLTATTGAFSGLVNAGGGTSQTSPALSARKAGNSFEFGHTNTAGYGSTIGGQASNGTPFIAFSAENDAAANTFTTRGIKGTLVRSDLAGGLDVSTVATASAGGQTPTSIFTVSSAGAVVAAGSIAASTSISASTTITAGTGLTITTGNVIVSNGSVYARSSTASTGSIALISGTTGAAGYTAFYGTDSVRQGYIGFGAGTSSADAGTINYVSGTHAFTGAATISTTLGVTGASTLGTLTTIPGRLTLRTAQGTSAQWQQWENTASYSTGSAPVVGAIVFTAPYKMTDHMQVHEIVGFNYGSPSSGSWSLRVGFYNYSGGGFYGYGTEYLSDYKPTVRLAYNAAGYLCIIIADVATSWQYPKVAIARSWMGQSGTADTFMDGWTSSLVTDLSTYTSITTPGNVSLSGTGSPHDALLMHLAGTETVTGAKSFSASAIALTNGASNWIYFSAVGVNPPAFTARSAGTKLVLYDNLSGSSVDYGLGIDNSTLWSSVPTTASGFKWYGGTTLAATLTGTGALTLVAGLTATTGTFSGAVNGQTISSAANFTGTVAVNNMVAVSGGAITTTSSGSLSLRLGRFDSVPSNGTDAYVGVTNTGGPGSNAGDLILIPRTSAGVPNAIRLFTGQTTPVERLTIDTNGLVTAAAGLTVTGTTTLNTALGIASGGTNSTATPTAGGAGYGTGTAHAYTAAGSSGQVLTSNGASAPTWQNALSPFLLMGA